MAKPRKAPPRVSQFTEPAPLPPKPEHRSNSERAWLIRAASAAWHAANPYFNDPDAQGDLEDAWDSFGGNVEMARFYYWRWKKGPAALDDLRKLYAGEAANEDAVLPKPKGFRTWQTMAATLWAELGLDADVSALQVGQKLDWSVYHLRMALDPKDLQLFDADGLETPESARRLRGYVASIERYGGCWDPCKAVKRDGLLWVADGRQRRNAMLALNEQSLEAYFSGLVRHLRFVEPQAGILEDSDETGEPILPRVLVVLPVIVHDLADAQLLKNISNTQRKTETALQEAQAIWQLMDDPVHHAAGDSETEQIKRVADLRGCSHQTIRNAQDLRKLTKEWMRDLQSGRIAITTGYRLGRTEKKRQKACTAATKAMTIKVDAAIHAFLDGKRPESVLVPVAQVSASTTRLVYGRLEAYEGFLAKLETPEARAARLVLAALRGDHSAQQQLPPEWQAGMRWDGEPDAEVEATRWKLIGEFTAEEAKKWRESGVSAPHAAADLRQAGVSPEQAAQQAPGALRGVTLGRAFESGALTLQQVTERVQQAARQQTLPLALPGPEAAAVDDATEILRGVVVVNLQAEGVEIVKPFGESAAPRSSKQRRRSKDARAQFSEDERDAWLAAGLSAVRADALRALGITADDCFIVPDEVPERALAVLGDEAKGRTLGELHERGCLDAGELQALLARGVRPVPIPDVETTSMPQRVRRPWGGFTREQQTAWERVGITRFVDAVRLRGSELAPEDMAYNVHVEGKPGTVAYFYNDGQMSLEEVTTAIEGLRKFEAEAQQAEGGAA